MKTAFTTLLVAIAFIGTTVSAQSFYKQKHLTDENTTVIKGQSLSENGVTITRFIDDNGVTCYVSSLNIEIKGMLNTSISCLVTPVASVNSTLKK